MNTSVKELPPDAYKLSEPTRMWVDKYCRKSDGRLNIRMILSAIFQTHVRLDITKEITEHNKLSSPVDSFLVWFYDLEVTRCGVCGSDTKLLVDKTPPEFRSYCSERCRKLGMGKSGKTRDKINAIHEQKFGKNGPLGNKEVRIKSAKTMMERYGVENPNQSAEIRERIIETNITKYGGSNPMMNPDILEKAKTTLFEKYGVRSPMLSDSIKQKAKDTNNKRYGVPFAIQFPEFIKKSRESITSTCMERYGVPTVLHDPDMRRYICSFNNTGKSKIEQELFEFTKSLDPNAIQSDTSVLSGKQLDIYCPEHKLAIEFNGLYWHSEVKQPDNNYHLNKTLACEAQGIQLIHIWEDEWHNKKDVVKGLIRAKMGLQKPQSYARKYTIEEGSYQNSSAFLEQHHIQGKVQASHYLHLVDKTGNIQAVMLFTKRVHGIELVRFASNNCHGAFSKLLSHAIKYVLDPNQTIYSFGDRCVVSRLKNVYIQNGFVEKEILPPDYKYVVGGKRVHKFNLRKSNFSKMGYDIEGKTEDMLASEANIDKIWGCGLIRYELQQR
ncbi:hypothetical protein KXE51_003491 [Salmonella enterica]|nr:hypothetical protein [Salmonella enterica]